jgi:hypothetical protein
MIDKLELVDWLNTLPEDSSIGVDSGGLALLCDKDSEAYLEIGGMPEELADAPTNEDVLEPSEEVENLPASDSPKPEDQPGFYFLGV